MTVWYMEGTRRRVGVEKICKECGKTYVTAKRWEETSKYCSQKCHHKSREKKIEVECAVCKTVFTRTESRVKKTKHSLSFCSRKCKEKAQHLDGLLQLPHYKKGKYIQYRAKALQHYGEACCRCGYKEDVRMLDVDHIDGNRRHNKVTNLRVLCVWCHALKTRGVEDF